jgi:hypothetical protein
VVTRRAERRLKGVDLRPTERRCEQKSPGGGT